MHPRRHGLQKFFSTFPNGWPGAGLLILRIAVAVNVIAQGVFILTRSDTAVSTFWALGVFAIITGFVFMVGFLTPIVGSILAIGYLIDAVSLYLSNDSSKHTAVSVAFYLALISLALALLGPGAFSVDARLFGRLEIIIPERRHPPR